jgi:hypothetical protein
MIHGMNIMSLEVTPNLYILISYTVSGHANFWGGSDINVIQYKFRKQMYEKYATFVEFVCVCGGGGANVVHDVCI